MKRLLSLLLALFLCLSLAACAGKEGKDGASAYNLNGSVDSVGPKVKATDTTGAGDAFIGSFLWKMHSLKLGRDDLASCPLSVIKECLDFSNRYCSISVQRPGAIPSYPEIGEILAQMEN